MDRKERFCRTEMIFGAEALAKLAGCRVAVFGVGGVGGYVVEALARSGVGAIDVIDKDRVCESNINRQILALSSTIGRLKTEVAAERIADINPECKVTQWPVFYTPETSGEFDFGKYDYVVDAVDTVTAKIELVLRAKEAGVPIISSMGTGNKTDPTKFRVADIYKTEMCPLAKVMRHELKKRGVARLKVVFSPEEPVRTGSRTPGSNAFTPSVAGLIIAGEVVKELISWRS